MVKCFYYRCIERNDGEIVREWSPRKMPNFVTNELTKEKIYLWDGEGEFYEQEILDYENGLLGYKHGITLLVVEDISRHETQIVYRLEYPSYIDV